jgi:predicted  nucleic acid-binding Zn-ribbon protein
MNSIDKGKNSIKYILFIPLFYEFYRTETEERLNNYENQIEHLIREHTNLLDQVQKQSSSSVQTIDNESQTDDQQHDKLAQVNSKLKRVLQGFKEKLHRIATERPDLFANIGEETTERFDHLISIVEYQAAQIGILQAEHDQSEEQLRNEIQDLQR